MESTPFVNSEMTSSEPVNNAAPSSTNVSPAAPRISVGEIYSRAFGVYKRCFGPMMLFVVSGMLAGALLICGLLGIILTITKPNLIALPPMMVGGLSALAIIVGAVLAVISHAAMIVVLVEDGKASVVGAWKRGLTLAWPLFVIGVLSMLVVIAGYGLLIPALVWGTTFSIASFVVILEGRRGLDALVRSREWMRGDTLATFGVYLLAAICVSFGSSVISGLVSYSTAQTLEGAMWLRVLIQIVIAVLVMPVQLSIAMVVYRDLVARKTPVHVAGNGPKQFYALMAVLGVVGMGLFARSAYNLVTLIQTLD